ncbi:MAG: L,D-transpeptidase family protein [Deltaproteobacteria bacterium]
MKTIIVLAFMLLTVDFANATPRDEAQKIIFVLNQTGLAETIPDEMGSVTSTFKEAEKYKEQKNSEMSEKYYLLATLKGRVLLAKLLEIASDIPAAETKESQKPILASIPPALSGSPATPSKSEKVSSDKQTAVDSAAGNVIQSGTLTQPSGEEKKTIGPATSSDAVISAKLVGDSSIYTVKSHDTLRLVAAKLGVSLQYLATINNLDLKTPLTVGQKLKFNNRKIIPQRMANGIVINIPDRTLYYFKEGKLSVSLPVALGVPKKSVKYDWKTPTGKFKITAKQKDPTWHVPPSIQSEMEEEGKEVVTIIPPGPQNPLGKYAIKTSIPGILIHSTTKPGSIYSFSSHGCIRVYPEHMEEFFKEIKLNTPGEIIYRPVKVAVTENGRVFMEVHQDIYGTGTVLDAAAKQMLEKQNLSGLVDWKKVESVIKLKSGIAEDITL